MQDLLDAISDPTRRAALALIWNDREHCVCELMTRLGATQSRMSRHLKVLRDAGLILDRRDAQWVRYRKNPDIRPEFAAVIAAVLADEAYAERQSA